MLVFRFKISTFFQNFVTPLVLPTDSPFLEDNLKSLKV